MTPRCTRLLLAAAVSGCAAADLSRPPAIRYGEDLCAECRMLIQDARFAAARLGPEGAVERFDDVGCLLRRMRSAPRAEGEVAWVHDYTGPDWLRAEAAWYVRSPRLLTPMGSGMVAVAGGESANALADTAQGVATSFEEARAEAGLEPADTNGRAG